MKPDLFIPLLVLGVTGICFALVAIQPFLKRRDVIRFLKTRNSGEIDPEDIARALAALNASTSEHTFGFEQAAHVQFRRERITLIWGDVGFLKTDRHGPTWGSDSLLYALADPEQTIWMKENADVFSPIHVASPMSVFKVSLYALEAELDRKGSEEPVSPPPDSESLRP